MKLMTKAITKKAQAQYPMGNDFNQAIVAKFFDPCGSYTWYLMNQDPEDPDYLWGIIKGQAVEVGSFSFNDLKSYKGPFGIGIERDLSFRKTTANEVWNKLQDGNHI